VEELIDFGDEITPEQKQYLQELLERTTFDEQSKKTYMFFIDEIDKMHQFEFLKSRLLMNEIQDKDRIAFGMPYNQSDIKKTLKNK
jgi:NAD-dependent SIR2 family protein deacetylase